MLYGLIVALIGSLDAFAIYATLTFDTLVFEAAVVLLAKALPLEVHGSSASLLSPLFCLYPW